MDVVRARLALQCAKRARNSSPRAISVAAVAIPVAVAACRQIVPKVLAETIMQWKGSRDDSLAWNRSCLSAVRLHGVEGFLERIRDELVQHTYMPLPARRQEIPKDEGKVRVLSIPAIRDRVVQGALKLVLEPIFEADFQPGSFGYRPKRTAHEAVDRVARAIVQHKTRVIDIDLRSYFDNVRHDVCWPRWHDG